MIVVLQLNLADMGMTCVTQVIHRGREHDCKTTIIPDQP